MVVRDGSECRCHPLRTPPPLKSLPGHVHRGISEAVPCDNSTHYLSVNDGLLVDHFISRSYRIALTPLLDALRTLAEIDLYPDELSALFLSSVSPCMRISLQCMYI